MWQDGKLKPLMDVRDSNIMYAVPAVVGAAHSLEAQVLSPMAT
jgi:hypothetical protein